MSTPSQLALGLDLSTQQLKIIAIDVKNLEAYYGKSLTFETDLAHYKTTKGVYINEAEHEVYSPVEMWIEALDKILDAMKKDKFPFENVVVISGACQQHASVFWSLQAKEILQKLRPDASLKEQICPDAFSHSYSPNWQDHSTTAECETIEQQIGGADALAKLTGSKAHHRFTGPQILKFRKRYPDQYKATAWISLASSFIASLFLGEIAPIDISDVCGMNLWDITQQKWSEKLLEIVDDNAGRLRKKLSEVELDGGAHLGKIHSYFTSKYNFSKSSSPLNCIITPFTGDNPATITSLPLSPMDSLISLGTSTTLLLTTETYAPSPSYHIFNHPTTKGLYFAMLCYKNGSLAREQIRDKLNQKENKDWTTFNKYLSLSPVLGGHPHKLGFYFPLPEIIPGAPSGTWRFAISEDSKPEKTSWSSEQDVRAIVESQALSMRLRARPLLDGKPNHLYFVGGASQNTEIVSVMASVLGSREGVFRLNEGVTAGACARGSAIKAAWAYDGKEMKFEDFVRRRWNTKGKLEKLEMKEDKETWDEFGKVLDAYDRCEEIILSEKE